MFTIWDFFCTAWESFPWRLLAPPLYSHVAVTWQCKSFIKRSQGRNSRHKQKARILRSAVSRLVLYGSFILLFYTIPAYLLVSLPVLARLPWPEHLPSPLPDSSYCPLHHLFTTLPLSVIDQLETTCSSRQIQSTEGWFRLAYVSQSPESCIRRLVFPNPAVRHLDCYKTL